MSSFFFIEHEFKSSNRHLLSCFKNAGSHTYSDANFTRFFILQNGSITTNKFTGAGDLVARVNGEVTVNGDHMVIETPGYLFNDQIISSYNKGIIGDLSYIDGCSNTNLISPPRNGDPCMNYLYFPPEVSQQFHTHPSVRIGLVVDGSGIACTPSGEISLIPGKCFYLDRHMLHRFKTTSNSLSIVVFHPDSDDGPRDEANPMKTRTYL